MEIKNFNFLKDEPASKEQPGFFKFYHENFSPALKEIVENDSCVHTIGLFGRWGTGKSTIIDLLEKELKLKLFLFDAWKYQDDSLRRIFLIKLVEFLKSKGLNVDDHVLDPLYKSSESTIKELVIDSSKISFFKKIGMWLKTYWLIMLVIISLLAWLGFEHYTGSNTFITSIKDITRYLFSLSAVIYILKPVLEKVLDESMKKVFRAILPWSEVRTRVEKEDRLNSPEQFEKLFNKIFENIDEKIIIVFDNVDRVQGDTAIKILSTIKTFLDPVKKSNVVFIVPCDAEAIAQQIKSFYGKDAPAGVNFDPSEYLRKIFNLVIYTPEFIDTDLEEYTKQQLNQTGDMKDLLLDEDVVLVINKAFSNNPREIKQFINNLVSMVLIASKTEVKDLIVQKNKIAYLAKILVLKQKFPEAYIRLKEKWYEPDNILKSDDPADLTNFLNGTSRITTDDAEPYIYFKKPAVAANIDNAQPLRQHLLAAEQSQFESALLSEKNKEAVVDYVLLLLKGYQNQHDPLLQIFKTQLEIFTKNGIVITKKSYFDEALKILDVQLWQDYLNLDVNLIFPFLLNNSLADKKLKTKIIERYILALTTDQLKQPENKNFLLSIMKNILAHPGLISAEQKLKIAQAIEQGYFNNSDVLSLFQKLEDQDNYITTITFEQYLKNIDRQNLEIGHSIIIQYKNFILKNNLTTIVLKKMQEWFTKETADSGDYTAEKESFATIINKLLSPFHEKIKDLAAEEKRQFGQVFTQAFNSISAWDNRSIYVNALRWILPNLDESQKNECTQLVTQFFQNASAPKIKYVIDYWSKDFKSTFLGEHIKSILPRLVKDDNLLKLIYQFANKDQTLQIINYLIQNKPNSGLDFIGSLADDLPDREEIIRSLLGKAESLNALDREGIYKYVDEKLAKGDDTTIKDLASDQIKKLLKTDDPAQQKIAYDFLSGAIFLSEDRKRDIGKEILEYLRQPGKATSEAQMYSLRAVNDLYETLQETPKRDFLYLVFGSITQEKNKAATEIFLQILKNLAPQFSEFEKDYKDLYNRLQGWPEGETKTLVISKLLELKSSTPSIDEKDYWSSVEQLIPKEKAVVNG